jgi:hypothetical protein
VTSTADDGIAGQAVPPICDEHTGGWHRAGPPVAVASQESPLGHSVTEAQGSHTLVAGQTHEPNAEPALLHVAVPVSVFAQAQDCVAKGVQKVLAAAAQIPRVFPVTSVASWHVAWPYAAQSESAVHPAKQTWVPSVLCAHQLALPYALVDPAVPSPPAQAALPAHDAVQ